MTKREYKYIYAKKIERAKKAIRKIFNNWGEIKYAEQLSTKGLQKYLKIKP